MKTVIVHCPLKTFTKEFLLKHDQNLHKSHELSLVRANLVFYEIKKAYNCPETFDQLEEDFLPFLEGIDLRELWRAGNEKRWGTEATIHYVIYNQQVYTKRLGKITDFKMFVDGMIHSLLRKGRNKKLNLFNIGRSVLGRLDRSPRP